MKYQNISFNNIEPNVIKQGAKQYREQLEKSKNALECVHKCKEFLESIEQVSEEDKLMVQVCCLAEYFDWNCKQQQKYNQP